MAVQLQKKHIIIGFFAALFVCGIVYFGIQYTRMAGELSDLKNAKSYEGNPKAEIGALLKEIQKVMELPSSKEPSLATVSDADKLKNQALFANAKNGDKLLIFADVRKAILYRPSTKKIVDVAILTAPASQSAQPVVSPTAAQNKSKQGMYLLNGTKTVGLTKSFEKVLVQKITDATVVDRDNAKDQTVKKTVIVDVSGKKSSMAQEIAQTLSIQVGTLPVAEPSPPEGVDFVIIVGDDFSQ